MLSVVGGTDLLDGNTFDIGGSMKKYWPLMIIVLIVVAIAIIGLAGYATTPIGPFHH